MSEKAVVSVLLANAGVTAAVGSRVHSVWTPQALPRPNVTYELLSDEALDRTRDVAGHTSTRVARVLVNCWADSIGVARDVGNAVRVALDGFAGEAAGVDVIRCWNVATRGVGVPKNDGTPSGVYGTRLEFRITYRGV